MIDGWLFLAIGAFIAITDLAIAHFFARALLRRAEAPPMDGVRQTSPLAAVRFLRLGAVIFFLIFAAIAFGLVPCAFVHPISLH